MPYIDITLIVSYILYRISFIHGNTRSIYIFVCV